jgi:hypothetical protein
MQRQLSEPKIHQAQVTGGGVDDEESLTIAADPMPKVRNSILHQRAI